ncbi:NAD-dependent epimerase/dehydratase [Gracilibacillus halophilus YIM-C55.5]|uniref:NAD-dependent epimerase/dehydratase n=1 Tax=Gracilibacillus halophilus YIM-C55.5 TaxID=1308866 RepID=N4W8L4_9BACI|nr:NAD-dependent epimerase/dehydratase family protein [Gracilibacillus halophilus]ENH96613.1 NAD-dependent epimerase/dehydratase [Gracilibacillus halophilus YIM-C55.5]
MKRILVTGGAGFIGSHLIDHLLDKGYRVTAVDNLSNGSTDYLQLAKMNESFQLIVGDILNKELMENLMETHDLVYHLAAVLGVKNTVDDPLKVIEGNVDGTKLILELAYQYQKKVIFASTSEIYGRNPELPYREDSDRILGDPSIHRWCYATAKALDEHLCFGYAKKGLPVTIVRFFNAYGPRQTNSDYGGVVPIFITKALKGEDLPIHGDGTQLRTFGYIGDVVRGLEQAMEDRVNGEAINIGGTEHLTIQQLAEKIIALTGSDSDYLYVPYEIAYGEGYEDIPSRLPSIDKARELLHYSPRYSLSEGLLETIQWYQKRIKISQ